MNAPFARIARALAFVTTSAIVCLSCAVAMSADDGFLNEGFTEPYRTVHVAAPESGIVAQVFVREGATIEEGQSLAQLDVEVHEALLAIAEAGKQSHGPIAAAEAEAELRRQRVEAIRSVRASGHASREEFDRAEADLKIAHGQLAAAKEAQRLKQLEFDKIQVQINRRTIRAPLGGVVTTVFKEPGEFTAPNDPHLFVVVQLDPLAATFDVLGDDAHAFVEGQSVRVKFSETGDTADAEVEYVSPVIDAESGTIAVKVRIPNPNGELQSGAACTLEGR
jgi:RND family efflux transporter MFP subunit